MTSGKESYRSAQQRARPVPVGTTERALSRGGKTPKCPFRDYRIRRSDLLAVPRSLFEVVARDLVLLDEMHMHVEPRRELLVQGCTRLLRHRLIGCVTYEQMTEAERLVTGNRGLLGADQFLADKRQQVRSDSGPNQFRRKFEDGATVEDFPLHRATLDHGALVPTEPIETRLQQRVDRRRHNHLSADTVLAHHCDHLFDEQRIAFRRFDDAPAHSLVELGLLQQVADEKRTVV